MIKIKLQKTKAERNMVQQIYYYKNMRQDESRKRGSAMGGSDSYKEKKTLSAQKLSALLSAEKYASVLIPSQTHLAS